MEVKEAIEFLERLLTSDPYSEDIFLPIPKEDFTKINELLKKELGYPLDRLSGNIGRELYKSLKNSKEINNIITLLKRGEKYEAMWEEDAKEWLGNDLDLEMWMNDTKHKYFPKEEVEADD